MPVPHLHIFHPPEVRLPGITEWLAQLSDRLGHDTKWDGCRFHLTVYDAQASFNLGTAIDRVRRAQGPVVLIQKVQARLRQGIESAIGRFSFVIAVHAGCTEDLVQACEDALAQHEAGEPLIPEREAVAYLILRKLARQDKWGGMSLNKAFLWEGDLPNGGFPRDLADRRQILDVAAQLRRLGVLVWKVSEGERKYALGEKQFIQPVLDGKSFVGHPRHSELQKFFEKSSKRVTVRVLDYDDG